MPTDEIFDDPNMNEMIINPDLYGLEENEVECDDGDDFDE